MPRSNRQLKNWQRIWIVALSLLVLALGIAGVVKMAAEGLFWGVIFLTCGFGLLQFRAWGRSATLAAVTVYEINVWINHLCFDASSYARQSWLGDSLQSVFLLALVWAALSLPGIRKVL